MKNSLPRLAPGDVVVCVYANSAAGPGWANQPLWIVVRDVNHKLREECLQPDRFTLTISALYAISESANDGLCAEVHGILTRRTAEKIEEVGE